MATITVTHPASHEEFSKNTKVAYTHARWITFSNGSKFISFHKSEQAAIKAPYQSPLWKVPGNIASEIVLPVTITA